MKFRHTLSFFVVAALAASPSLGAQSANQQSPPSQTKPEAKPESKPPASIAGKWNMTVDTQQGAMQSVLDFKLDGKKVSGTVASPQGEIGLEGEYADGKLTFSIVFQGSSGSLTLVFNGAQKENGTLAGTMDYGQGQSPWRAERPKQ